MEKSSWYSTQFSVPRFRWSLKCTLFRIFSTSITVLYELSNRYTFSVVSPQIRVKVTAIRRNCHILLKLAIFFYFRPIKFGEKKGQSKTSWNPDILDAPKIGTCVTLVHQLCGNTETKMKKIIHNYQWKHVHEYLMTYYYSIVINRYLFPS